MSSGTLFIQVVTAGAQPIRGAHVITMDAQGNILLDQITDANGIINFPQQVELNVTLEPSVAVEPNPVASGTVATQGENLNLRSGPGTDFPVITKIPNATLLSIQDEQNGFYFVTAPSGQEGWASAAFIRT